MGCDRKTLVCSPGESLGADICLQDPLGSIRGSCHTKPSHVQSEALFHRPLNILPMASATVRPGKKGALGARGRSPALPSSAHLTVHRIPRAKAVCQLRAQDLPTLVSGYPGPWDFLPMSRPTETSPTAGQLLWMVQEGGLSSLSSHSPSLGSYPALSQGPHVPFLVNRAKP